MLRLAKEILKIVEPDIVLVCCGGGSLLAGLSSGLSLSGSNSVVYGVEPELGWNLDQFLIFEFFSISYLENLET